MIAVATLLAQLAAAAAQAAVDAVVTLVRGRKQDSDKPPEPLPPGALTYRAVEKMRSDERASIAASKTARAARDKPT